MGAPHHGFGKVVLQLTCQYAHHGGYVRHNPATTKVSVDGCSHGVASAVVCASYASMSEVPSGLVNLLALPSLPRTRMEWEAGGTAGAGVMTGGMDIRFVCGIA